VNRFPGLGSRFADRLHDLGFWKDEGPDVGRFCREKGYRPQYVYAWLKDRVPGYDNLRRLAADLDVPIVWFVAGETGSDRPRVRAASTRHRRLRRRRSDRADTVAPLLAPHIDLGPLREATERIATLRADLEALLAAFPDPCMWIDERGAILDVHAAQDVAVLNQAAGRHVADLFTPGSASALQRAIGRSVRGNSAVTVECVARVSDGEPRTYEARIRPVAETRPRRGRKVLAVLRDVSQHKEAANQYRELAEGATNGLCVHIDYAITFANRAMARLVGAAAPAELLGQDIRDIFPDHRIPKNMSVGSHITVRPSVGSPLVRRDGKRIDVNVLARPVSWASRTGVLITIPPPAGSMTERVGQTPND